MTWRIASRREDARALLMLDMREDCMSAGVIGRLLGMSDSAVRVATNRILDADLRESGEPAEVVRAAYWRVG